MTNGNNQILYAGEQRIIYALALSELFGLNNFVLYFNEKSQNDNDFIQIYTVDRDEEFILDVYGRHRIKEIEEEIHKKFNEFIYKNKKISKKELLDIYGIDFIENNREEIKKAAIYIKKYIFKYIFCDFSRRREREIYENNKIQEKYNEIKKETEKEYENELGKDAFFI